jgi:hypothetical protein
MENNQKGRFFIRFSNEGIALSPEHVLTFSCTNLPYTSMQIHPHAEWYWYVSIRNYDKSTGRLQVHVDEYKPSEVRDFFTQTLLNSHATYLWSYDMSTVSENLALRKLEYALSMIRKQGRQTYRLEMPEDLGSSDLIFHVIRHDHISSGIVDSFPVWRARLHERLV